MKPSQGGQDSSKRTQPGRQNMGGGKYKFVKKLGSGAFADVIQAHNTQTGQQVAIKKIKATYDSLDKLQNL